MNKCYIPVQIEEGMFSNEKTVSFSEGGRTVSLIVDARDIVNSKLRVRVVHQMNDKVVIDLPGEPFSGGARLSIPATMLSSVET